MNARAVGARAEDAACAFLRDRGYEILARNLRLGHGELDIVARRDGVTAFVEVKYRRDGRFGTPAEAVTPQKRERYRMIAKSFCAKMRREVPVRFDVASVLNGKLEYFEDAFM